MRIASVVLVGAGLLLASMALRICDLSADPPYKSVNGTAFADEGFWTQPAAWASDHGEWPAVDPPVHRLAPLYAWLVRALYSWLGPTIEVARGMSVVSGVVTCFLTAWILWPLGRQWALLALAFQGFSPWGMAFDRFATPEATCMALLAGAAVALTRPRGPRALDAALGLSLIGLATAVKPVAVFLLPAALAFQGLPAGREARHRVVAALLTLLALALVGAVLVPGWLGSTLYFVQQLSAGREPLEFIHERYGVLARVPFHYEFTTRHGAAAAGVVFLFIERQPAAYEEGRRERFAWLWLVCWLAAIPLTMFSLFRFAYLSVPVTILGVIGWRRLLEQGWPKGWARGAGVALGLAWGLAMASMQLSDLTGVRARFWLPVLLLGALALLVVERLWSEGRGRLLLATTSGLTLALLASDMSTRTYLVRDAARGLQDVPLDGNLLCGFEAPSLTWGASPGPTVLTSTQVWNTDCSTHGQQAELVLLPESSDCTPDGSLFVARRRRELLTSPRVAALELPTLASSRRGGCRYLLVRWQAAPLR